MSGRPLPGTNDELVRPPMRYRRFGGGYRREDVDLLLAEFRLTLRAFELELSTLRERGRELEGQLAEARAEVDRFRAKGYELARAISSARDRAVMIERDAEGQAAARIAEAEAEATARLERAKREIAELGAEKEGLLVEIRGLVDRLGETIAHAESEQLQPVEDGFPGVGDLARLRAGARQEEEQVEPNDDPFGSHVELDVGPFVDFDSVAGFERALADLPSVEDVYVRRVRGERAVVEITLAEGVPLLEEMRKHLPYGLEVRARTADHLVLDVAAVPSA